MQENIQETSTDEVNVEGGWLVTHHTRTWDTRVRLDSVPDKVVAARIALDAAQIEYDAAVAKAAGTAPSSQTRCSSSNGSKRCIEPFINV